MRLHVLNNLLNVRLHALDLLVLVRVERQLWLNIILLLVLTLFRRRFAVEQDISTHERILLVFVLALLEYVRPIAKLIQLRRPVVILKVAIDIDEGKVRHARPIQDLRVNKAPRLRERRFPEHKHTALVALDLYLPWDALALPSLEHLVGAVECLTEGFLRDRALQGEFHCLARRHSNLSVEHARHLIFVDGLLRLLRLIGCIDERVVEVGTQGRH